MVGSERISVIIPVYNTEKYLEKSVRSVMDQTYGNLEIICVNDGSTDGSAGILRRLQQEDPRIVIVEKENGGLGDARNAGLERATSEWVSFLDSDDTLRTDTYEIISGAFGEEPDLICFGINVVMGSGEEPSAADRKYYSVNYSGMVALDDKVIRNTDASVGNKLFRKSVLDRYGIRFEKIYYEDFPFTMEYFCSVKNAFYFQELLYNYLRRSDSIMAETFKATPRSIDHLRAVEYLYAFLEKHELRKSHEPMLAALFNNYYWLSIKYSVLDMRQEIVDYAKRIFDKYDFLHTYLRRKHRNGTVYYERKKRKHFVSVALQALFSVRWEFIDYRKYKVIRVFNIMVYKKPVPES